MRTISWTWVTRAAERLRRHAPSLALAATSASVAHLIATMAFGRDDAFFAPIAAVVCTGLVAGQRIRRAVELSAGVAVGLVAADLLVGLLGSGPWQLGIAVLFATGAAVALGAGPLMSNQAAVAAILVTALSPDVTERPWVRLGGALIGGSVALAIYAVIAPDPARVVRRMTDDIMRGAADVLGDVAAALGASDLDRAERALDQAQAVAARLPELDETIRAAQESARLGPHRRRASAALQPLLLLRARLDLIAVTTRSTTRAAANAVRHGQHIDDRLVTAVQDVSRAMQDTGRWALGSPCAPAARGTALRAAAAATTLLDTRASTTIYVLVAHVRTAAIDILRATGMNQTDAVEALEAAAGPADRPSP